jgi:hypothetical protein
MKWFKHMSDMLDDPRIRRLIKAHGARGYAIYNAILERIVKRLESDSPLPDLEETSADIADILRDDTAVVQDVTWYCIEQGLIDQDEITGRIVAHKIYKFLEAGATKSIQIKEMIKAYKAGVSESLGKSETFSDGLRRSEPDKNRIEEKRREERKSDPPFRISHDGESLPANETRYRNLCDKWGESVVRDYLTQITLYCAAHGKRYDDYAATVAQWIKRDVDAGKGPRKAHRVASLDDLQSLG